MCSDEHYAEEASDVRREAASLAHLREGEGEGELGARVGREGGRAARSGVRTSPVFAWTVRMLPSVSTAVALALAIAAFCTAP